MGSLKRVRGLFEGATEPPEPSVAVDRFEQSQEHEALPWPPRSVPVSRLVEALREITDATQVNALADADDRRTAAAHYTRRLVELEAGSVDPSQPAARDGQETDPACDLDPEDEAGSDEDEHLRITAYVTLDQVEHLEGDRSRIRRAFRVVLDRTTIIRALLEGYRLSGLDPVKAGVQSEQELAALVAARLKGDAR